MSKRTDPYTKEVSSMRFTSPADIPTNKQIFGEDPAIYNAVARHTRSIYPAALLLLTPDEARSNLRAVGTARIETISNMLADYDLRLRSPSQPTNETITQLFGDIMEAPVSILQMTPVANKPAGQPKLHALTAIATLETIQPMMMVGDLLGYTIGDVGRELTNIEHYDRSALEGHLAALKGRLRAWRLSLKQPVRYLQGIPS